MRSSFNKDIIIIILLLLSLFIMNIIIVTKSVIEMGKKLFANYVEI